jgi:gentisate 1,2-dioxygenase
MVKGAGVRTAVNGDPVRMSRYVRLLTPGWNVHGHPNVATGAMGWT